MNLSPNKKRASPSSTQENSNSKRIKEITLCEYGDKCFRRNPIHLKEYLHPHLHKLLEYQNGNTHSLSNELKRLLNEAVIQDQLKIMKENNISYSAVRSLEPATENLKISNVAVESKSSSAVCSENKQMQSNVETTPSSSGDAKRCAIKVDVRTFCPVLAPRGQFRNKLEKAAPYNIFYTTIVDSSVTHVDPLSITFQELLDTSLGNLESSMQINFMVDISWLMAHYVYAGYRNKPLTILYGADDDDLLTINKKIPTVTAIKVKMADAFGTHHTKVMLFHYEDRSMRIVVSTANLYVDDWHNRVQGLWVSPTCPPLSNTEGSNSDEGNGPTNFKKDLLDYLYSYKLECVQEWINRVRKTDFTHINVFFVASVPGMHRIPNYEKYGHTRIAALLSKYCTIPNDNWNPHDWSIICQCSSIGSLGVKPESWLCGQIRNSFSRTTQRMVMSVPNLSVVYPSLENVRQSYDNLLGGGCLPYTREQHVKQTWLEKYLCQWKANSRHRNRAMPHIKTYCRVSPDLSQMSWFLLTSANLSKSAWGNCPMTGDKRNTIRSYEVGVLFLPRFVTDQKVFLLDPGNIEIKEENVKKYFPFPYDLPLTQYSKTDSPFFMNYLRE